MNAPYRGRPRERLPDLRLSGWLRRVRLGTGLWLLSVPLLVVVLFLAASTRTPLAGMLLPFSMGAIAAFFLTSPWPALAAARGDGRALWWRGCVRALAVLELSLVLALVVGVALGRDVRYELVVGLCFSSGASVAVRLGYLHRVLEAIGAWSVARELNVCAWMFTGSLVVLVTSPILLTSSHALADFVIAALIVAGFVSLITLALAIVLTWCVLPGAFHSLRVLDSEWWLCEDADERSFALTVTLRDHRTLLLMADKPALSFDAAAIAAIFLEQRGYTELRTVLEEGHLQAAEVPALLANDRLPGPR